MQCILGWFAVSDVSPILQLAKEFIFGAFSSVRSNNCNNFVRPACSHGTTREQVRIFTKRGVEEYYEKLSRRFGFGSNRTGITDAVREYPFVRAHFQGIYALAIIR